MTKKKLKNTKKIHFRLNPNLKQIEAIKDDNTPGRKYNEKGAYDLIKSIETHDTHISISYNNQARKIILDYINNKNKKLLSSLKTPSQLESKVSSKD